MYCTYTSSHQRDWMCVVICLQDLFKCKKPSHKNMHSMIFMYLKLSDSQSIKSLWRSIIGRIQSFLSCWTEGVSSSLTVGLRPHSIPYLVGLYTYQHAFLKHTIREDERNDHKMVVRAFCNLITEVTFHHFYQFLLARSKSLVWSTLKGRILCKDLNTER